MKIFIREFLVLGGLVQSVMCLLCKPEDLGSIQRTNIKKIPDMVRHTYNLSTGESETGSFLGLGS